MPLSARAREFLSLASILSLCFCSHTQRISARSVAALSDGQQLQVKLRANRATPLEIDVSARFDASRVILHHNGEQILLSERFPALFGEPGVWLVGRTVLISGAAVDVVPRRANIYSCRKAACNDMFGQNVCGAYVRCEWNGDCWCVGKEKTGK